MYKDNVKFSNFCEMLNGLQFFPFEHVFEGMAYLKKIISSEGEDILNCFDTTYVNGPLGKVEAGTKYKSTIYNLNVHKTTMNGDHWTNNIIIYANRGITDLLI